MSDAAIAKLEQAIADRGSATSEWAVSWLQQETRASEGKARDLVAKAKAEGRLSERGGVVTIGSSPTKPNPSGRSKTVAKSNKPKSAPKRPRQMTKAQKEALRRGREALAEARGRKPSGKAKPNPTQANLVAYEGNPTFKEPDDPRLRAPGPGRGKKNPKKKTSTKAKKKSSRTAPCPPCPEPTKAKKPTRKSKSAKKSKAGRVKAIVATARPKPTSAKAKERKAMAAKKTKKRVLSKAQKEALKKGQAALAAKRAAAAAAPSKPRKAKKTKKTRTAKPKTRKPKTRAKTRRAAPRVARAPKKVARRTRPTGAFAPAPAPLPPAARRAAPKPRKSRKSKGGKSAKQLAMLALQRVEKYLSPKARKPKKTTRKPGSKKRSGTLPTGIYRSAKTGAELSLRRHYAASNPTYGTKQVVAGAGGLVLGVLGADIGDRLIATRTPKGGTAPLNGGPAAAAIQNKSDGIRLGVQGGATALLGLGAFLTRHKAPTAAYFLGGLGLGTGIKFLTQLFGDHILPAIFKETDSTKVSFANRVLADKQCFSQIPTNCPTTTSGQGTPGAMSGPYTPRWMPGFLGAPMGQVERPFVDAPAVRDVGPVATGAVGCGGSTGCGTAPGIGHFGPATDAISSMDLSKIFPSSVSTCKSCGCQSFTPTCDKCQRSTPAPEVAVEVPPPAPHTALPPGVSVIPGAAVPATVPPGPSVTTRPILSLADIMRLNNQGIMAGRPS